MMANRISLLSCLIIVSTWIGTDSQSEVRADDAWQAGVARIVITPDKPMYLSGYGGRDHNSEGKVHDLYARAAAIRDSKGTTAVFISTDLIGVPIKMVGVVSAAIEKQHGIPRKSLMFTCSHTHCGPALDHKLTYMLAAMTDADWVQVKAYQEILNAKITQVINAAIADLKPAVLSTGNGNCAFASNRRTPKGLGPYDHQVPVLKIASPTGKLRGLVFGYACHNTTLGFYQWCGDYAGFAQLDLEGQHEGIVAMFHTGCGADQNPLPRRKVELAQKYGRLLSHSVNEVLEKNSLKPVTGELKTAFSNIPLEYSRVPSAAELKNTLKTGNAYLKARANNLMKEIDSQGKLSRSYDFPVQVWQLGNGLKWVALGGEVVVDYQIRLKRELGADSTWVTGYANDVMAYIPSERVLEEGGYEGDTSMIYYQLPAKWKTGLENQIVNECIRLAK
jgi:neutral ceramidase